ncbi:methyltransferase family protein [Streptomyces sp. NPDC088560]|uniref:methyltransferase family protein n=1 Tax=Streptomyces sp. NPDC088560 TaxID=3365868 RepID=UPI00381E3CF1
MGSLHSALALVIVICFLIFYAAWIVGAVYFGVKSHSGVRGWWRGQRRTLPRRLLLIAGVYVFSVLVGRTGGLWRQLRYWQPGLALLGAALAVASTALLLWARWVLGTMWASVPTVREHHELRTDGPYGLVRHPIYTGLLGLVFGGMLARGFGVWVAFLIVAVPWMLLRVRAEDRLMAGRFGPAYEAYRARVPALIPWTRRVRTDVEHRDGVKP